MNKKIIVKQNGYKQVFLTKRKEMASKKGKNIQKKKKIDMFCGVLEENACFFLHFFSSLPS